MTKAEHRIRWFGVIPGTGPLEDRLVPRTESMPGKRWGWDAKCSCGWESRTGGAIQERIKDAIKQHLYDVGLRKWWF